METTQHKLSPPSLDDLVEVLTPALKANFEEARVSVEKCPDLRKAPFYLATEGLSGTECIADVGGQPNLFPEPRLECKYSLLSIAREMQMRPDRGQLLGAGAGPFHHIGVNSELAPNLSWEDNFDNLTNLTTYTKVTGADDKPSTTVCARSPTSDCALMVNLYGSSGLPGPVLKIIARGRRGQEKSFPESIRRALAQAYGETRPISLGGVFVLKTGRAYFHVMPNFAAPHGPLFVDAAQLQSWLTFHTFPAPMVCLSVFHTAEPEPRGLGLRMEHTHCFSPHGGCGGGHYHYDLGVGESGEQIEYEAYFNTAKVIYRINQPEVTRERDPRD